MQRILNVHTAIYKQFHSSSAVRSVGPQDDDFVAYSNSMYLIADTAESVMHHMQAGFSKNPMEAYLEFWGVMQAIIIQQDAISELHRAIVGTKPERALTHAPKSAWGRLRKKRDLCAGHPATAPQRAFMGRKFGDYDYITYELRDAGTKKTTHPVFNLRQMIGDYDKEASHILRNALTTMKSKWP
jgi:hypothetical protein